VSNSRSRKKPRTSRIDSKDQVSRFLGQKYLEICPDTGAVLGLLGQGFALRTDAKELELSVNHLQYFSGASEDQVRSIKNDMEKVRKVGGNSAFAVLAVGRVSDLGRKYAQTLQAFRKPEVGNPSHAEVNGLPPDNGRPDLLQDLADAAFEALFLTKNL
jgi:hypothetical protein